MEMQVITTGAGTVCALLPDGKTRDLRVNGRWLQGCSDLLSDKFPVMLVEEGVSTYWNVVEFNDVSYTHIGDMQSRTVRMRTRGEVLCW